MVYDAFPTVLELRLLKDPGSIEDVHAGIEGWIAERWNALGHMYGSPALPDGLGDLVASLLRPLDLPVEFVADLAAFEWDVYRLLFHDGPGGERWRGRVLRRYGHDMTSVDEVIREVEGTGPVPRETFYLFDVDRKDVLASSFDPRSMAGEARNATVRRMSVVGRRIVRAEHTVKVVLSRMTGRPDPLEPEVLVDGGTVTADRLEEILG
jgi:hypothetical protein